MNEYSTHWGASVSDVLALAPHVTVVDQPAQGSQLDPEYDVGAQRYITIEQVAGWVNDVASRVQAHRLALGVTAPHIGPALDMLAGDAVKNGAASYLVDAAFPARSGVNDAAAYGQVLWARHQSALASMVDLSERAVDPDAPVDGGPAPVSGAGRFPPPSIPDPTPWGSIW